MSAVLTADLSEIQQEYDVRLRQRGQITVPQQVREDLNVREGDSLSLVRIGSFVQNLRGLMSTNLRRTDQ